MAAPALAAAVEYLVGRQNPDGSWTDFWLPVGTSDAWVTAFVGLAVLEVSSGGVLPDDVQEQSLWAARRAGRWLLAAAREGWGYNAAVACDADSTAHAVSLLSRLRLPFPSTVFDFLERHRLAGSGYRTYIHTHPAHAWTKPTPDVTAAVLRTLFDAGRIQRGELAERWASELHSRREPRGGWRGYWWIHPEYPTGLVLEIWNLAGKPPRPFRRPLRISPAAGAFVTAWACLAALYFGKFGEAAALARRLIRRQDPDGGWTAEDILRVPPHHGPPNPFFLDRDGKDARRLFCTASALRALAAVEARSSGTLRPGRRRTAVAKGASVRSDLGGLLAGLVLRVAGTAGFSEEAASRIGRQFTGLTRRSLASVHPWPSRQLSCLAGGSPLEFSFQVGPRTDAALRYAAELGDPFLPAYARARSALEDIQRTVEDLGYGSAWERIRRGIDGLVSPEIPSPNDQRFWVWSGIDQKLDGPPSLKIYINLLFDGGRSARDRLETALRETSIPVLPALRRTLDLMDETGFLHETGFGMGPHGRIACKIYYELNGWRPRLVEGLLADWNLPPDLSALRPEIPGILRESLAGKSRAGIAFRLNPADGTVEELTVSAAFPPAMLSAGEISRRLLAWIGAQGWDTAPLARASDVLLPKSDPFPVKRHSLFTRSAGRRGTWTTIYLRPDLFMIFVVFCLTQALA